MNPRLKLSVRCQRGNRDHHLWNNNGTFWCHFTVHRPDFTKERVRRSLGTDRVEEARRLRDALLGSFGEESEEWGGGLGTARPALE